MGKSKNPWLADAADGATMESYEIRAISDFLKVPEARRQICLREFDAWMITQEAVLALLEACGAEPGQFQIHDPDVFVWHDDGKATMAVEIREPASSVDARLTYSETGTATGSAPESSSLASPSNGPSETTTDDQG